MSARPHQNPALIRALYPLGFARQTRHASALRSMRNLGGFFYCRERTVPAHGLVRPPLP